MPLQYDISIPFCSTSYFVLKSTIGLSVLSLFLASISKATQSINIFISITFDNVNRSIVSPRCTHFAKSFIRELKTQIFVVSFVDQFHFTVVTGRQVGRSAVPVFNQRQKHYCKTYIIWLSRFIVAFKPFGSLNETTCIRYAAVQDLVSDGC